MVISSTSTVAVIIQAVSPLLTVGAAQRRIGGAASPTSERGAIPREAHVFDVMVKCTPVTCVRLRVLQSASASVSPVRMRTAWSIGKTKILPSPIWPVLAAAVIASITLST